MEVIVGFKKIFLTFLLLSKSICLFSAGRAVEGEMGALKVKIVRAKEFKKIPRSFKDRSLAYSFLMQEKLMQTLRKLIPATRRIIEIREARNAMMGTPEKTAEAHHDGCSYKVMFFKDFGDIANSPEEVSGCMDLSLEEKSVVEYLFNNPCLASEEIIDFFRGSGNPFLFKTALLLSFTKEIFRQTVIVRDCLQKIVFCVAAEGDESLYGAYDWCREEFQGYRFLSCWNDCRHGATLIADTNFVTDPKHIRAVEIFERALEEYATIREEINRLYSRAVENINCSRVFILPRKSLDGLVTEEKNLDLASFILGYNQPFPPSLDAVSVDFDAVVAGEGAVDGAVADSSAEDEARVVAIRELLEQERRKKAAEAKKEKDRERKKARRRAKAREKVLAGAAAVGVEPAAAREKLPFIVISDDRADENIDHIILYRTERRSIGQFLYTENEHVQKWFESPEESFEHYRRRILVKSRGSRVIPDSYYQYGCVMHRFSREVEANMWDFGVASGWSPNPGVVEPLPQIVVPGELHKRDGERLFGMFAFTFEILPEGTKRCFHRCFHKMPKINFLKGKAERIYWQVEASDYLDLEAVEA